MNIVLNLIGSLLPKLVDKVLTPENIEKYSDKVIDAVRTLVSKAPEELQPALNQILDVVDEAVGE